MNLSATVPSVGGTFSPQRPLLRLDGHGYSPDLLKLIVSAGGRLHSFGDASFALSLLGLSMPEDQAPQDLNPAPSCSEDQGQQRTSPQRLVRTCVASMAKSRLFGPMMAAQAQLRNFYAARRKAFVADGQAYNWSIQEGYFGDFEPIVDLLHVICYLFGAAHAHPEPAERWPLYVRWLKACWSGGVGEVLVELESLQEQIGRASPGQECEESDPRRVVAVALGYLEHNRERMDYPRYRRMGLPTTSSLVELLVGEFNARVKAKQKFWNRPEGAEAILQVRAALLSEDDRLDRHFAQRQGSAYRRRAA